MTPLPCPIDGRPFSEVNAAVAALCPSSPRPTRRCRCCGEFWLQRDPADQICDRCDALEISEMIQPKGEQCQLDTPQN